MKYLILRPLTLLTILITLSLTGCVTAHTIEVNSKQWSDGEYGWAIFGTVVGIPFSLFTDVFTLGGTLDPEILGTVGTSAIISAAEQKQRFDNQQSLRPVTVRESSSEGQVSSGTGQGR
jgi:hypothetical protein